MEEAQAWSTWRTVDPPAGRWELLAGDRQGPRVRMTLPDPPLATVVSRTDLPDRFEVLALRSPPPELTLWLLDAHESGWVATDVGLAAAWPGTPDWVPTGVLAHAAGRPLPASAEAGLLLSWWARLLAEQLDTNPPTDRVDAVWDRLAALRPDRLVTESTGLGIDGDGVDRLAAGLDTKTFERAADALACPASCPEGWEQERWSTMPPLLQRAVARSGLDPLALPGLLGDAACPPEFAAAGRYLLSWWLGQVYRRQ